MKLLIIFPVANNQGKIPSIIKKFKEFYNDLIILGADESIPLKFGNVNVYFLPTNTEAISVPKGRGILEQMKNVSEKPDVVLVCDGSDAIPYNYIVDIFQEFVSDASISCVMAHRAGEKSISSARYLIERFEVFSLKKYYGYQGEIPDGQCGLWCFKYGKFCVGNSKKEIKLTAQNYEIELDLLGEVIKNKLKFSFVPISLPIRQEPSAFKPKNNIDKMDFLKKQHIGLTERLPSLLQEFEGTEEFKKLIPSCEENEWIDYKKKIIPK